MTPESGPARPLLLVRGGHVFGPADLGQQDLLIAAGRILAVGRDLALPASDVVEVVDARGTLVLPGFIDGHVHVLGGGGEGGPQMRTRDVLLGDITCAGGTTVVGLLGTDCLTRGLENLLAKVGALTFEGITAYALTGGYPVPTPTLTGSVARDIYFVESVVGVGEVAICDQRSSQPTADELARLVAEARQGGLLSGKGGTVVLHVGGEPGGLQPIVDLLTRTGIPASQVLPTHVNRAADMVEQAAAYGRRFGTVDVTAGISPELGFTGAVKPSRAVKQLLEAGVSLERITISTDANGNMPVFDADGQLVRMDVAKVMTLYDEVRDLIRQEGLSVDAAIRPVTDNVARTFRLGSKGEIAAGKDADLVLTDPDFTVRDVYGRGRPLVRDGPVCVRGIYEETGA